MGGQNETVLKSDKTKSDTISGIRVHTNNGEIHFHNDKEKLKTAIPIGVWYNALNSLKSKNNPMDDHDRHWTYIDVKNKTMLNICLSFDMDMIKLEMVMSISIEPIDIDPEFIKLLSVAK